jgi:hypothetical protein
VDGHLAHLSGGSARASSAGQESQKVWLEFVQQIATLYGYGSIPINSIFRGMDIHLPAILMFTRGTRF